MAHPSVSSTTHVLFGGSHPVEGLGMIEDIIAMGVKTKTRIINIDYSYGSVMEDATESIFVIHIAEAYFDRIQNAFSDL